MGLLLALGCAFACLNAAVAHATVVSVTPNTITQTAITSPADPAYFYDPTAGAYGSITVTGTTNSTSPSTDTVDIYCYFDNGSTSDPSNPPQALVQGVMLNSAGGFSATIPYSTIEIASYTGECRLRAVPSAPDTVPTSGLSSFAGPRVLLSSLRPYYSVVGTPSYLYDYQMNVAGLGAQESISGAGSGNGCGIYMNFASQQYFGEAANAAFDCADGFNGPNDELGALQVDGTAAQTAWDGPASLTVSATQDPATGDMTIQETEPLYTFVNCATSCSFVSLGVQDQRTIQISAQGKVVLVTDVFSSTDGNPHTVTFDVTQTVDDGIFSGGTDLFSLPGQTGFSPYTTSSAPVSVGTAVPGTIDAYNNPNSGGGTAGYNAITYYNAPSGAVGFYSAVSPFTTDTSADTLEIPFTLDVPAGGTKSLSMGYAADFQQSALPADVLLEQDLYTPPAVSITAPAAGATVTSADATVTGSVSAATGVQSVVVNGVSATVTGSSFSASVPLSSGANTLTAVLTTDAGVTSSDTESVTYAPPAAAGPSTTTTPSTTITPAARASFTGPVWLPIANTGDAAMRGRKELLRGRVTSGSAAVSYYFQYGLRGHYNRRSRLMRLGAGKRSRAVSFTAGGLRSGAIYQYRLIARGRYGHATGVRRTFRAAARR